MITALEAARNCVGYAEKATKDGDIARAGNLFLNSAKSFLSLAVAEYDSFEQARVFLMEEKVSYQIEEGARLYEKFLADVRSGQAQRKDMSGEYVFITMSHLSLLLGLDGPARTFSRLAVAPETIVGRLPYFWNGYAECYARLLEGKTVQIPTFKKLRDEENYWFRYIELMALLSEGTSVIEKTEELGELFTNRQSDKKINDWYGVEGDAHHPAKWNFRLQALLLTKQ